MGAHKDAFPEDDSSSEVTERTHLAPITHHDVVPHRAVDIKGDEIPDFDVAGERDKWAENDPRAQFVAKRIQTYLEGNAESLDQAMYGRRQPGQRKPLTNALIAERNALLRQAAAEGKTMTETPVNLTKRQKELLREFEDEGGNHSPESEGFFTKVRELWDDLRD